MKKMSTVLVLLALVVAVAKTMIYTVNEKQYALVFMLGEIKEVVSTPGLHVKLPPPFQNVVYLDKRVLNFDDGTADLVQTREKKNMLIDTFVKWRIENPRLFWVSFQGSEAAAENRLSQLLRDALNVVVNKRTVNQITSVERDRAMMEISQMLQDRVKDVGIGIVDVRFKRVDFTPEISESVYRRMEAERKRVASEERSKGEAQATRIRAGADRESEVILAQAYRDAQQIKGQADAKAAAIYNASFGLDPEFAKFYRSMAAYKDSFANKQDMMVVDTNSPFFEYFRHEKPTGSK